MVSKRQLGFTLLIGGLLAIGGLLIADGIGASRYAGIGPFQRNVIYVALAAVVLGLTLLPLGERPA